MPEKDFLQIKSLEEYQTYGLISSDSNSALLTKPYTPNYVYLQPHRVSFYLNIRPL